eukprot:TRINITY_DN68390_c0_g1_i5.p1 TRINITY_DN68390_c0_g1~~TRINITY_DN68390_c0_g1_i5.p1  ORF type:complete len:389 (+),score=36.89 TRINITY_DN68390_c0_g1_i5:144-1169(+)
MEGNICTELIRRLEAFGVQLHMACAMAGELDCIIAMADMARENNYCKPTLTKENLIIIKQGRHPLTELLVKNYIPNDTIIYPEESRIHIITGPNLSGKSCYAKQVALIVYLAHIGSYVPADEAMIGITDRIFTRLNSVDSSNNTASSFLTDLTQISSMLRMATSRSLLIVDEFGKGTLAEDGVGLLCGSLQWLSDLHYPPRVLAVTHFTDVLKQDYLPINQNISRFTMAVHVAKDVEGGDESDPLTQNIVFLYKLVEGIASPSFGIYCAKIAGIEEAILQRASQVMQQRQNKMLITPLRNELIQERESAMRQIVALMMIDNTSELDNVMKQIDTLTKRNST